MPNNYCTTINPMPPSSGAGAKGSGSGSGSSNGLSNIANSIQDSLNKIKNNGNNSTNNNSNLNPPVNILSSLSPANMDRYVALNISLFTLIIMALITFITFRKIRHKEESKSI